ncbi:AEC family transporter [Bosea sp. CS1GBMeth4]|uniref:AEC family transporter n=1 Tax=Bosea sp. CS1GBMeth4 TaxID=1892849 RepID=UPI001643FD18|nr:AEC family transporter [Bosea sp. CS1GBMeth4]
MLQFLATSTPFFAVIALGAFTGWRGLFQADAVRVLNTFAFMVATPAMVLRVMSRQPIVELWNGVFFAALALIGVLVLTLAILLQRRLLGLPFAPAVSRAQALVGGNFAFLGIPLMLTFLGDRAAAPIAIGLIEAGRGQGSPLSIALRLVRGTIVNPFMLSILAGVALSLSGAALPEPVDRFLLFLGASAAPVGVFALGIAAFQWSRQGRPPLRGVLPLVTGKLVLHPLLTFIVLGPILHLDPFWVQAGVLYAALPIAANVFVISERFDTGSRPIAAAIVISTAAAALTFPLALWLTPA